MKKLNIFKFLAALPVIGATAIPLTACTNFVNVKLSYEASAGGKIGDNYTESVRVGTRWGEIPQSERPTVTPDPDYDFDGWYYVEGEEEKPLTDEYKITKNINIIAKFVAQVKVQITFVTSPSEAGEISGGSTIECKAGTKWKEIKKPSVIVSDENYTFDEDDWYIGDEKIKSNYTFNESTTVTAKLAKKCLITYTCGQHGTIDEPSETPKVKRGIKWGDISGTQKPGVYPEGGYELKGYYVDGEKITDDFIFDKDKITVNVEFMEQCQLTFTAGSGGTINPDPFLTTCDHGKTWKFITEYTELPQITEVTGVFDGWYVGDTKLTDSYVFNDNATIVAKFISTTLNFVADQHGSLSGTTSFQVKPGTLWKNISKESLPTALPESGYEFKGWYVGDTLLYDDYEFNANTTITAKFMEQCTITYSSSKGGSITSVEPFKVNHGTLWKNITNRPTATADEGYVFDGWYVNGTKLEDETEINDSSTIVASFMLKDIPTISSFSSGTYNTYSYELISESPATYGYVDKSSDWGKFSVAKINDSSIGYMTPEYMLGRYSNFNVTTSTTDHITTITNNKNSAKCYIDYKRQTITFPDYESFIDYSTSSYGPMTNACTSGKNYWNSVTTTYTNGNAKLIDLKDYGITIYEYNGNGYLPFELYKNIFNIYLSSYTTTLLDFNGAGFYSIVHGYSLSSGYVDAKAAVKNAAPSDFYNEDYMKYCYNLLALTLDTRFGLIKRNSRAQSGQQIQYLPNGAYSALELYKNDLLSTDSDKSATALRNFFKNNLDDGGHSYYSNMNIFSTADGKVTKYSEMFNDEYMHTRNILNSLKSERSSASVTTGYKEYQNETSGEKIAYVTFDKFAEEEKEDNWSQDEIDAGRELPSNTRSDNYMNDTFRMTMYANREIQTNNIKNVVVDLSCNSGGAVYAEHFIASWLCGGVTEKIYNPTTNSYCEYEVKADIDGDGKYDDNDHLAADVNLYVITSSGSFSCGNMLPTNIEDNRTNNTVIMGTSSGGGACFVDQELQLGLNTCCQFSSSKHMLRGSSSYGNFITNDNGCSITSGWEIDDATNPADFYDRDTINNWIWYGK